MFFNPSHRRGENHNIRNCAQMRCAIIISFWFLNYVCMWELFPFFLCCCIHFSYFERHERVLTPFLLPLMVRSFLLSKTLLTCLRCRLGSIKLANIPSVSFDVALWFFLCGRSGSFLLYSHCFILTWVKSELSKWTICYGFRLFLHVQGMCFSLYWYFLLNTLPSSPSFHFDLSLHFSLFLGHL